MYATTASEQSLWNVAVDHWLWYDGEASEDLSTGIWNFHVPAMQDSALVSYLETDWEWNSADDMTATITIVAEGAGIQGDSLIYDLNGSWARLDVHDTSASLTGTAAWNLDSFDGWCTFPNYKAGATSCWNESGCDMRCP